MKAIQDAVTAYLQRATGVRTVAEQTPVPGVYPLLAVSVQETGTVLIDGGRQAEHTYSLRITAVSDRERRGNTALLASLVPVLLRGVPMGERTLHPLDIKTEGEALTCSVVLCVPVERRGEAEPQVMAALRLGI